MSADELSERRQQLHQTRRRPCKHGVLRGGRARGRPSRLKVQPPVARVLLPPVLTPQAGASQGSEALHQTHTAAGSGWTSPVVRVPDRWSPRSNTTTATPLCYCFLPASWCWCWPRRAPGVDAAATCPQCGSWPLCAAAVHPTVPYGATLCHRRQDSSLATVS